MNIIVCTDLLFSTRITGTAKALAQPFVVARGLDTLQQVLAEASPGSTLIVDLNCAAVDPLAAIALARNHPSGPRIVAFVSHVQAELAAAARQAGADRVLARSAFVNELPAILGGAAGGPATN